MGCYLALALLMVPLLGLMHGIVHSFSHGLPTAGMNASTQPHAQPRSHGHDTDRVHEATVDALLGLNPTSSSHKSWSETLFAGHATAADCLVFDQLCGAQALHFLPLQVLPTTLPSFVLVTLAGDFIARWAALYQARGPPSAR